MEPFKTLETPADPARACERGHGSAYSRALPQAPALARLWRLPAARSAPGRRAARRAKIRSTTSGRAGAAVLIARRNFGCGSSREARRLCARRLRHSMRSRAELRRHLRFQRRQERTASRESVRGGRGGAAWLRSRHRAATRSASISLRRRFRRETASPRLRSIRFGRSSSSTDGTISTSRWRNNLTSISFVNKIRRRGPGRRLRVETTRPSSSGDRHRIERFMRPNEMLGSLLNRQRSPR